MSKVLNKYLRWEIGLQFVFSVRASQNATLGGLNSVQDVAKINNLIWLTIFFFTIIYFFFSIFFFLFFSSFIFFLLFLLHFIPQFKSIYFKFTLQHTKLRRVTKINVRVGKICVGNGLHWTLLSLFWSLLHKYLAFPFWVLYLCFSLPVSLKP